MTESLFKDGEDSLPESLQQLTSLCLRDLVLISGIPKRVVGVNNFV